MTGTLIDDRVLQDAVTLACHAPSLHNSQPWRWVSDGDDHSKIFVLSTHNGDARLVVLRCGEALSAALLEGTLAGLASCTLTRMTETSTSREIIRLLTGQVGMPQLLIRFGAVPSSDELPMTPRRPLAEIMQTDR